MAVYFPQFMASKAMVQSGYKSKRRFQTVISAMEAGPVHTYAQFNGGLTNFPTAALSGHEWSCSITDAELATLIAFFEAQSGQLEEFIFLDPAGNLIPYSEDFSVANWGKVSVTVGAAATDPKGGTRATTLTATSSDSSIRSTVLPDGDANDIVLCGSVWAYSASGQYLRLGFANTSHGLLSSEVLALPAGAWRLLHHTTTLATSAAIEFQIGGGSTWNSSSIDMFGAQVVPMPNAGAYVKSPAFYGYRPKCRFDMPSLKWIKRGPNENEVSIKILEVF